MNEEPQDQPSAVYSTVQPLSDNTSGLLLKLNTSHACQHCSAVFMLSSSLKVHLETFHGKTLHSELPVASRLHDSASESTEMKPEPPWSVKEEPQDQPSAVYSTVQPLSDNTESLPSLNTSHVFRYTAHNHIQYLHKSLSPSNPNFGGYSPADHEGRPISFAETEELSQVMNSVHRSD
ncbi:hypothetical protein ACOMHN_057137 [Nucella lapillus]